MDNSQFELAANLLSPAKYQYNLSDDLSFSSLQKAFIEDRDMNVREWY